MATALLIMIREGFEAALVVAIVFGYVRRLDRRDLVGPVWAGVGVAAAIAVAFGIVVHLTTGSLDGANKQRAFAAVSLVALVVLTWMIFWMKRQSRAIKGELEHKVDDAVHAGHVKRAVAAVAFFAVLREGIEAALFLIATATDGSGRAVLVGGLLGLAGASALAFVVYLGGRKMPMRAFFTVTGVVLIVFAAGLAARTVNFLQSTGDLGSFNLNGVYDARGAHWLTQQSEVGRFLAAMFGWDPRPSIEQVVTWIAYLVPVTYLFLRAPRPRPARAEATPAPATQKTREPLSVR